MMNCCLEESQETVDFFSKCLVTLLPNLEHLYMGHNQGVKDIIAAAIAETVNVNGTLKRLELLKCNIGLTGALKLAECIGDNKSLKFLSLRSNPLTN